MKNINTSFDFYALGIISYQMTNWQQVRNDLYISWFRRKSSQKTKIVIILLINLIQVNSYFWLIFPSRVLVGASSDPTISVDDPISDEFFFLAWNAAAKLNATIYDKVHVKPKLMRHKSQHSDLTVTNRCLASPVSSLAPSAL